MLRDSDRFYLITDGTRARLPLAEVLAQAVDAGVTLVQLREKHLPDAEFLPLAELVRRVTSAHRARLLLNSRCHLAAQIGADGVHLPRDASILEARSILGESAWIGYSAHDADELRRAEIQGADFATLSPLFPTLSKPTAPALGLERFTELVHGTSLPVYALGGISPENAASALGAGAFGIAVAGSVMESDDVGRIVRHYLHVLQGAIHGEKRRSIR